MLTNVMELPKIQTRMIICWYSGMLKMEIYIIIYRKILKKLLGKIKFVRFVIFRLCKILMFYFIIIKIYYFICKYLSSKMYSFILFLFTKWIRLMEIHEKDYIHCDLHSGNILMGRFLTREIGDLGLCQQLIKYDTNEIFGVIPY